MKMYRIEGTMEAPVALKRDRQSDRSETVQSIPGTTLRGAIATVYLQQKGQVDETFRSLFLNEEECRFGPLDPAPDIYPLTMSACKRRPTEHPVVDQLAYRVAQHLAHGKVASEAEARFRTCSERSCGADLKPHTGFYRNGGQGTVEVAADARHVAAHVGIDRATGTAADGIFYTLEALPPQFGDEAPGLIGWVQATEQAIRVLRSVLAEEDNTIYLGHHRTRGYGRVRLVVADEPIREGEEGAETWAAWSDSMLRFVERARAETDGRLVPGAPRLDPQQDTLFAISLPTGAVLVDPLLRYTNDLSAMVPWLPPLPDPARLFPVDQRTAEHVDGVGSIRCITAVVRQQLLRGWNAAHGLPRQDEWLVARGSVYVYWLRGPAEAREQLFEMLSSFAATGVGLRRNEGYGQVVVNDPIHCQPLVEEVRP